MGYYRRFIPNFADISAPFTNALQKGSPMDLLLHPSPDMTRPFGQLKAIITSGPVLVSPDFSALFTVHTDASDQGVGAVLSQTGSDNLEHPILFISRKLFPRERKYSTIEKECLAIKWAVDKLRYYLEGKHFTLYTDHAPLLWMHRNKSQNPRVMRWFLSLQPFAFTIQHTSGKENGTADYLSRVFPLPERENPGGEDCDRVGCQEDNVQDWWSPLPADIRLFPQRTEWKEQYDPGSFNWNPSWRETTPTTDVSSTAPISSPSPTKEVCVATNQEAELEKEDADRVWSSGDETRARCDAVQKGDPTPVETRSHSLSSHTSGGVWLNKVRRSFAGWTGRRDITE